MANTSNSSPLQRQLQSLVDRISRWSAKRRGTAMAVGGGVLVLVVLGSVITLGQVRRTLTAPPEPPPKVTLEVALDALDHGAFVEARDLVTKMKAQGVEDDEISGPSYVLGAVAALEAEELWGEDRQNYFLLAARHLKESRSLGFPEGREFEGLTLLGKSLYMAGRYSESRPVLEAALLEEGAAGAPQVLMIHQWLAGAYRKGSHPDLAKALQHITAFLTDENLEPADREPGLLKQAQILWQFKDYDGCSAALDKIPPDALLFPAAALLRGRLQMRTAREAKTAWKQEPSEERRHEYLQKYEQAIQTFRRAQDDPLANRAIRRSLYLIGLCLLETEDERAALEQFARTRDLYLESPEGLAAGLWEADLLRMLRQHDEAVAAYRRVLGAIKRSDRFVNPWIPQSRFRSRVLAAHNAYLEVNDYPHAIALAQRMHPLFPQAREIELVAEAYRSWARRELVQAAEQAEPMASEKRREARTLLRKAGRTFAKLAAAEFTERKYPDDLWQAAECFLDGHDFRAAAPLFEDYLRNELRRRRPRALVNLAEARLALHQLDESLAACQECLEFYASDAASFKARLIAARAFGEKGDATAAEELLRTNLNGDQLTPDSTEWRDSLFTLGKLLATAGRYEEAIERLEEAVTRYPDTLLAVEGHYLIAEASRQAAKVPTEKLLSDTIETARIAHQKQKLQLLGEAIRHYEAANAMLNQRQEKTQLTPLEKAMQRNAYYAIGSAQFDLGRYEDAIRTYSAATNRYQHDPEVLEAFVQIAHCYRRLNRPQEARGAVQQAKVVLNRIPPESTFGETTNFSRREWTDLLDWLSTL